MVGILGGKFWSVVVGVYDFCEFVEDFSVILCLVVILLFVNICCVIYVKGISEDWCLFEDLEGSFFK